MEEETEQDLNYGGKTIENESQWMAVKRRRETAKGHICMGCYREGGTV
jgi:hypothetical protein